MANSWYASNKLQWQFQLQQKCYWWYFDWYGCGCTLYQSPVIWGWNNETRPCLCCICFVTSNICQHKNESLLFYCFLWYWITHVLSFIQDSSSQDPQDCVSKFVFCVQLVEIVQSLEVMKVHWVQCEDFICHINKTCTKYFDGFFGDYITFDNVHQDEKYIISLNTMHFATSEFHLNPRKWYDYKRNCAGCTYELAMTLWWQESVFIVGPITNNCIGSQLYHVLQWESWRIQWNKWSKCTLPQNSWIQICYCRIWLYR